MSTALTVPGSQAKTLESYVAQHFNESPQAILQMVLADRDRAVQEAKELSQVTFDADGGLQAANLGGLWRLATLFASSSLVPEAVKGKAQDVFVLLQLAMRKRTDPFMLLQHCYVVHGRPGIDAQLAIAWANTSGVFSSRIRFALSGSGDSRKCVASATIAGTGEVVEQEMSVATAKAMGWWSKKDRQGNDVSLWPKMTDLMLQYRAASWLIRTNAPEITMGLPTVEELRDTPPTARPQLEAPSGNGNALDELAARLESQAAMTLDAQTAPAAVTTEEEAPAQAPAPTDDGDVLEPIIAAIRACKTLTEVRTVYDQYCGPTSTLNEEDRGLVSETCEFQRNEIKATRGSK